MPPVEEPPTVGAPAKLLARPGKKSKVWGTDLGVGRSGAELPGPKVPLPPFPCMGSQRSSTVGGLIRLGNGQRALGYHPALPRLGLTPKGAPCSALQYLVVQS